MGVTIYVIDFYRHKVQYFIEESLIKNQKVVIRLSLFLSLFFVFKLPGSHTAGLLSVRHRSTSSSITALPAHITVSAPPQ